LATSAGPVAAPAASWVSGTKPSTGTASGMVLPSAPAPVNRRHTGLVYRGLRLLLEEDCVCAVYSPSTMLASGSEASTAGATVSAWGMGADSSAAGVEPSSATAALGSSPSQDKSVDFLYSTQSVVNQVRLPIYMYYSGKIFTYKLDRTIVTVGAPSMLAMWTSPASVGASSSALVAAGSSAAGVAAGSVLPSATGACGSTSITAGAGLRLLSAGSPPSPSRLRPLGLRGRKAESPASNGILSSAYTTLKDKYSTTLLEEFTS
jgi:hypothetical protein